MDIEKVIKQLESLRDICNAKSNMAIGNGKIAWAGYANTADDAIAMLKEQEAKHPVCEKCGKEIDHINISVFNYDGSDSDYSIPITYNKENGCVSFSTSQKWTGYDLTDKEQKEGIRCPYCGKFPFDDSIEIEFYEPVEVMMWTSEGR